MIICFDYFVDGVFFFMREYIDFYGSSVMFFLDSVSRQFVGIIGISNIIFFRFDFSSLKNVCYLFILDIVLDFVFFKIRLKILVCWLMLKFFFVV